MLPGGQQKKGWRDGKAAMFSTFKSRKGGRKKREK
jgi:hypothetical protein